MGKTVRKKNNNSETNAVPGANHIIFKNQVPKFKIDIPIVNEYSLYLSEFSEEMPQFATLLNELRNANPNDIIKIFINSPGGCVSEGKALINTLQSIGADIQTELIANAYSMGALLFCIGDKRVIYENSSIMFHNFSGGFGGKGHELKDRLKHTIKNITAFFRGHIIGLTEAEIKQMINGKDWWFGSKEMCERGIATHVNVDGIMIPAKRYLKALKKAKKKAKKQGIKVSSITESLIFGIDVMTDIIQEQNEAMDQVTDVISEAVTNNEFLYN
jgi:ATP-dependent protease ClpP protease subunit